MTRRKRLPDEKASRLHQAVVEGKLEEVRDLLNLTDANVRDHHGRTPLMTACFARDEHLRDKMFRHLFYRGADLRARDPCGRTVFAFACSYGLNQQVKWLLNHKNVDLLQKDREGRTPLHHAVLSGDPSVVRTVARATVDRQLSVDIPDNNSTTPYVQAKIRGQDDIAQILLTEARANPCTFNTRKYFSVNGQVIREELHVPISDEDTAEEKKTGKKNLTAVLTVTLPPIRVQYSKSYKGPEKPTTTETTAQNTNPEPRLTLPKFKMTAPPGVSGSQVGSVLSVRSSVYNSTADSALLVLKGQHAQRYLGKRSSYPTIPTLMALKSAHHSAAFRVTAQKKPDTPPPTPPPEPRKKKMSAAGLLNIAVKKRRASRAENLRPKSGLGGGKWKNLVSATQDFKEEVEQAPVNARLRKRSVPAISANDLANLSKREQQPKKKLNVTSVLALRSSSLTDEHTSSVLDSLPEVDEKHKVESTTETTFIKQDLLPEIVVEGGS
ncbi:espin-like protein [Branchiostoma lanceolatum]|uniref:espin-like protein n=1 Tax=Branchiostoma lanceolatum TaxID=7740 RepID=UPI00345686F7